MFTQNLHQEMDAQFVQYQEKKKKGVMEGIQCKNSNFKPLGRNYETGERQD